MESCSAHSSRNTKRELALSQVDEDMETACSSKAGEGVIKSLLQSLRARGEIDHPKGPKGTFGFHLEADWRPMQLSKQSR
jgi:hypothetical protein